MPCNNLDCDHSNFAVLTILMLNGCAESALITGQTRTGIDEEDVVIYYIERPGCNFETIAHIQDNGGFYSMQKMLNKMRPQAAEVGASGLYVLHTQLLDVKEYLEVAKAIRCRSV